MCDNKNGAECGAAAKEAETEAQSSKTKTFSACSAKRIVFRKRVEDESEDIEHVNPENLQSMRNFKNFPSKVNPPFPPSCIPAKTLYNLRAKSGYLPARTPGPLTIGETYEMVESELRGWPVRAGGGAGRRERKGCDAGPAAL